MPKYTIADPHIAPGTSGTPAPDAWRKLPVARQGDDDYACGLFTLLTAAHHLGALPARADSKALLRALPKSDLTRIKARLPSIGLCEKDLRALASAASLSVYRPNTQKAAQFRRPGWLWMALVLVKFTSPQGGESCVEKHYILVLDYLRAENVLVVADPHPWNPSVYCVGCDDFEAAWGAAEIRGHPWAASLRRRSI